MMRVTQLYCFMAMAATLICIHGVMAATGTAMPAYRENFAKLTAPPRSWKIQGQVIISKAGGYQGRARLTLQRTQAGHFQPCAVVMNSFPVQAGRWRIEAALKSKLYSPDISYNGQLSLQVLNAAGSVIHTAVIGSSVGTKPWHLLTKTIAIPVGAVSARFTARLNKTWGTLSIDNLAAAYRRVASTVPATVTAIAFACKAPGSLFYPQQPVLFTITVRSSAPLREATPRVICQLADYWGADFSKPIAVKLVADDQPRVVQTNAGTEIIQPGSGGPQTYTGTLNLSAATLPVPLQQGKYYSVQAVVPQHGVAQPYRTHWAFAILPPAATNKYPPFAIPFTQRNWDGRIPEDITLSHRLGVRVADLWSGWNPTPPYASWAPGIHLCKKFQMGALMGVPNREANDGNDPQWTATALRMGAERFVNKYKNVVPFAVSLGNEPGPTGNAAARKMIAGYKAIYEGIKAADPKILVVGTSCGTNTLFFKNGFQKYLDAYDYHDYGNSNDVPATFKIYHQLFQKYGHPKPVWSTETGLNASSLTRSRIARTMIRKFALFFADGGENISWFDLLYPNGGGKHMRGASFNVFHIRYGNYCPKMTAVCYYNLINGICVKKAIASKTYPGQIHDVLFKDNRNHCLQIIWKTRGQKAKFIPLRGVGQVKLVHIDGSIDHLNAHQHGITINTAAFPLLLLYTGTATSLPATLGAPAISLAAPPASIVKGGATRIALNLRGVSPDDVRIIPPPFWRVAPSGKSGIWLVFAPKHTTARQARMTIALKNGAGELYFGIPVTGQIVATLLPTAKTGPTSAGLQLLVRNNDITPQTYLWHISLNRQYPMAHGGFNFARHVSVSAYFGAINSGRITVVGGGRKVIALPIDGLSPQTIYHLRAVVRNATGQGVVVQRVMSGFVGVPYVSRPIPLNGTLHAAAWAKSPVLRINQANQFFSFSAARHWHGPQDLSGTMRLLWSKKYLYVGVHVTDCLFCNNAMGVNLWQGDGLQFLVDPVRAWAKKIGYYDYSMAVGRNGPQAWCNSSADSSAPVGNAADIVVSYHRLNKANGDITYVLAIPWSRLAPFRPAIGADLGLSMILNDANTHGRNCYMGWYAGVSSKAILHVGDLILGK